MSNVWTLESVLAYGLAETGPTMTMTRFSDSADKRLTLPFAGRA